MTSIDSQDGVLSERSARKHVVGISRTTRARIDSARRFRSRPETIRLAIDRAPELVAAAALSETDCKVLIAIIATCVDASDGTKEMFAKKGTLARLSGCSESTFYRSYKQLRLARIINVQTQDRHRDGSMAITMFSLAESACLKLGLPIAPLVSPTSQDDCAFESVVDDPTVEMKAEMKVGLSNVDQKSYQQSDQTCLQSYGKQSAGSPSPDQRTIVFVKRHGYSIPADLAELVDHHGLRATAVLKLMKISRSAAGHRLSEIYAVVRNDLDRKGLQGIDRYRYLASCARDTARDWTFVANRQAAHHTERNQAASLQAKIKSLVGQRYLGRDSGSLWVVEQSSDGCIRLLSSADLRAIVLNPEGAERVLDDIAAGRLLPWKDASVGAELPCHPVLETSVLGLR